MPGPSRETPLLNPDFQDMLSALSAQNAEFLIVGAYALAAYGHPRATGDMDIWIRSTPQNAQRVYLALANFGAPLQDLTTDDLQTPDTVFQVGVAPRRIDILTSIDGVQFDEAWPQRHKVTLGAADIFVLSRTHLIQNKKAAGRPKDQADVAALESTPPQP